MEVVVTKVNLVDERPAAVTADLLAVLVDSSLSSDVLDELAAAANVDLRGLLEEERFDGEEGKSTVFRGLSGLGARRLLIVGIGDDADVATGSRRRAGVTIARQAREVRADLVAVAVDGTDSDAAEQITVGFGLGTYRFDRHLSASDERFDGPAELTLVGAPQEVQSRVDRAQVLVEAVNHARNLVNESPNNLVPESLAQAAQDIASAGGLDCTIIGENGLHEGGFNLIMAVGKGSEHPPRLIHLVYRPDGEPKRRVALVGKGVTFDTGGYNLKPGASMLNMHCDMAGAAAVLGAAQAIASLRPAGVEVHFIVPTAENTIAANSFKPMDIFRGYGGKTVEIHNTDAEGRLLLADALAYAQEQGVDTIVDLATLTGACVVALGEVTAGLFSDDDALAGGLLEAAGRAGEGFWRMPLTKKLDKLLDTPMADMKNIGSRWGGAITAALFLKRWVELDQWAHLDIAGPAWTESDDDLSPQGGTGFGVATLVEFLTAL